MLHFITDAPEFVVREILALVRGYSENAWDADGWKPGFDTVIHVNEEDAFGVIVALKDWVVEPRRPMRPAIADPTYVLAAQSIERDGGFGSTPAAAFAR